LTLCVLALLQHSSNKEIDDDAENGQVVYIDTEGTFNVDRIAQISKSRFPTLFSENDVIHQGALFQKMTERLVVVQISNSLQLLDTLRELDQNNYLIENNVRLLIVDSITTPIKLDFSSSSDASSRQKRLSSIASVLKFLSSSCLCPVIVTNQIVSHPKLNNQSSETVVTAALGVSWAHAVNTRYILQMYQNDCHRIKIAKSAIFKCNHQWNYIINECGVTIHPAAIVEEEGEGTMDVLKQHIRTNAMPI